MKFAVALCLCMTSSLNAQSLIGGSFLDRHWPHALSHVGLSAAIDRVAVKLGASPTAGAILGIAGPVIVGKLIVEARAPGHWRTNATRRDAFADTWSGAIGVSLASKKWKQSIAGALLYVGFLHRWAIP